MSQATKREFPEQSENELIACVKSEPEETLWDSNGDDKQDLETLNLKENSENITNVKLESFKTENDFENNDTRYADMGNDFSVSSRISRGIERMEGHVSGSIKQESPRQSKSVLMLCVKSEPDPTAWDNKREDENILEQPNFEEYSTNDTAVKIECIKEEVDIEIDESMNEDLENDSTKSYNVKIEPPDSENDLECGDKFSVDIDVSHSIVKQDPIELDESRKSVSSSITNTDQIHQKTIDKSFKCSTCSKLFAHKYQLIRHLLSHTEEKPFLCPVCNKSFKSSKYLKAHSLTHSDVKSFKCSTCNKSFQTKSSLKIHVLTHSDAKLFNCSTCNELFKTNKDLRNHLITHSGVNSFQCSTCSKRFAFKSQLVEHLISHLKEKPFSCSMCNKLFKSKQHLKAHSFAHTCIKPFKCSTCNKLFKTNKGLRNHFIIHSDVNSFQCSTCVKPLETKLCLKRHSDLKLSENEENSFEGNETSERNSIQIDDYMVPMNPIPKRITKRPMKNDVSPLDVKMMKFIDSYSYNEPKTINRHLSFFNGILPSLDQFDENEVLEFQMGVLQLLKKIQIQSSKS